MIYIPLPASGWRKATRRALGAEPGDPCIICLREIKPPVLWWVHLGNWGTMLLDHGERTPDRLDGTRGQNEDGSGGQGFFPIGPGCVKRVPREYRFRFPGDEDKIPEVRYT